MPAFEGGNPAPVTTGGGGRAEQRAAVPVYVVSGVPPIGGRARRVVIVTSGPVEGGAAHPVYDAGNDALYSDEPALPVFVVSGSLGGGVAVQTYTQKVIALGPIAYWPQAESSGTAITDESGNSRGGTYTGVTLGATGIGDGRTAASYAGTGYGNIYSASLVGAFNGAEGTAAGWAQHTLTWNGTTLRNTIRLLADASNHVFVRKTATANQLAFQYSAGGTVKSVTTAMTTNSWFHWAMTWSKAADQMICYINGVQVGTTQTGLGVFAGSLAATTTLIGASTTAPGEPWTGNLAHTAIWASALSAAQIASLATV